LIEEERVKKEDFSRELERLLLFEEMSWQQKSKALWLREGDKNTVFHQLVNSNRRNNIVDSLFVNGSLSGCAVLYATVFKTV
jgi:hypothetical protein